MDEKKEKKKMGRPTDNPKSFEIKIRATKEDRELLKKCCIGLNKTQYDVVMLGIKEVYKKIGK